MNIFILDYDMEKNVEYYVDSHVVKQILESSQMLCTCHHYLIDKGLSSLNHYDVPYKKTHINHPCNKWVRESLQNYKYLNSLAFQMVEEYDYRYNKTHKCLEVLKWARDNVPRLEENGVTKAALAMDEKYRKDDVVESYRDYYRYEKRHLFKWKNREMPYWLR